MATQRPRYLLGISWETGAMTEEFTNKAKAMKAAKAFAYDATIHARIILSDRGKDSIEEVENVTR